MVLPLLEAKALSGPGIIISTVLLIPLATVLRTRFAHHRAASLAWPAAVILYPLGLRVVHDLALALQPNDWLDVWAWCFYGVLHFASPFLMGWWLWLFAPPSAANAFGWCLGLQNMTGLLLHLINPHAAPWYYETYPPGTTPDYSFPGNAAGLVRVDKVLGTHLYTDGFRRGPVVFGAIPSLHAATAVCCALFVARYTNWVGTYLMALYTVMMFFSTMYFHHHWAVDLHAGALLAGLFFAGAALGPLRRTDFVYERDRTTRGIDRLCNRPHQPLSLTTLTPPLHSAPPLFPCLATRRPATQQGEWHTLPTDIPLDDVEVQSVASLASVASVTGAAAFLPTSSEQEELPKVLAYSPPTSPTHSETIPKVLFDVSQEVRKPTPHTTYQESARTSTDLFRTDSEGSSNKTLV